jgi:signal transduction histidine kinase
MPTESFVVDAAILRELGERLIGRPAIALGELIKNSFDADASVCKIEFRPDEIVISDDGDGMSRNDFHDYWMRLFTTHKVDQEFSNLGRPLTGSKGIGRLAVHFLADELKLESTSRHRTNKSFCAKLDWRKAVSGQTLNTVKVIWNYIKKTPEYPNSSTWGTRITLTGLKDEWNEDAVRELGREVWMLRSPFKRKATATRKIQPVTKRPRQAEDFEIEIEAANLSNAREAFDETLQQVFSNWKARIYGSLNNGRRKGSAAITVDFRKGYPDGSKRDKRFHTTVRLPVVAKENEPLDPLVDRAKFEILIFKTVGKQPTGVPVGELRKYLEKFGNVSVYDAGFRLPYYGSREAAGQDWLSIAVDQSRRLNVSELLPARFDTKNKYMQDLPALGRIFGAVEVNTNHERETISKGSVADAWLQIQPGRDRLKDNPAFHQLRDLVRFSLDYYANRYRLLDLQTAEEERAKEPPSKKYDRAIDTLEANRDDIPKSAFSEVRRAIAEARKASKAEERVRDSRAALLAPLASAGMVALALNHELSREIRFLQRIGTDIRRIAAKHSIPELQNMANEFDEARRRLESIRELFAPLLTEEDKTATARLRVKPVVDQSVRGMKGLMPGVKFDPASIPVDLRFPLGSLAQWNALLQNVLANAWNALLDSDRAEILFRAGRDKSGREWLHISDSGAGLNVPVNQSQKLFEPFQRQMEISKEKQSIAIGGQGLGLAIVKMIADQVDCKVRFVEPEPGFSTTFEIAWIGAKK